MSCVRSSSASAVRAQRPDGADPFEVRRRRAPDERELVAIGVEVPVEPLESSAPFRGLSDQLDAITLTFLLSSGSRAVGGWKIAGSTAFGIDNRLAQLEAELAVLRRARTRDWRIVASASVGVDLGDPRVRAVVEAAVDADRPVDAVHHARAATGEAPQALEVEVEGVEEAGGRRAGDPVLLDAEARRLELAHERPEELVPAPAGDAASSWKSARSAPPLRVRTGRARSGRSGRAPRAARSRAKRGSHDGVPRRFQTSNPG